MGVSVGEVAALIVALISIGLSVLKTRPEIHNLTGDAAQSYSEAARNYAAQVVDLQTRLTRAEETISAHSAELSKMMAENADLRDWAERLVHQVRSLGGDPVKMRSRAEAK
jgi:hypothetical protein